MENQADSPLKTQQLLKMGFRLFETGFREILGVLLIQTFSLIVLFVVLFGITMSFYDNSSLSSLPADFITSMIISTLFILMIQFGFIASFTTKFWAIAHKDRISSVKAYRLGVKKALPLLAWVIIYLVIVGTGLMIFVVPGIILGATLFMGAALIIQDHYSVFGAFKASFNMVWPRLQQTLLYIVIAAAITLGIYFLTLYPLGLFISYITSDYPMLNGIFEIARYALVVMLVPLFVALIIPYYMEMLKLDTDKK